MTTSGNGLYTYDLTSTKIGSDQLSFKVNGTLGELTETVTYVVGTSFDQTQSNITISKEKILTNKPDESAIVTVELKYGSGVGIEGLTTDQLTLVTASPQIGIFTPISSGWGIDGKYQFTVTANGDNEGQDTIHFKMNDIQSDKFVTITYEELKNIQLEIKLSASESQVKAGDVVMIKADIKNIGDAPAEMFDVLNSLPGGFIYIDGSARTSSGDSMSPEGRSPLTLSHLNLINNGDTLTLNYVMRVGAGARAGVNMVYAEAFAKIGDERTSISNKASFTLHIDDRDPLFDDSLILGTVYHDRNGDGMQDKGEPGIPGVRIASAEGLIITTDQFGRYHIKDISGGKWERGRNFILKIDKASLPDGVEFITPNPLVRRITPGLPTRFDFAIQLPEESILEVNETLFAKNSEKIQAKYMQLIPRVMEVITENQIKEVTIMVKEVTDLSEKRQEYLQSLLNEKLSDEEKVSVGSQSQEVEGK